MIGAGERGVIYSGYALLHPNEFEVIAVAEQHEDTSEGLTSAKTSLQSHLMAFAVEKSRLENKVIDINEFTKQIKRGETESALNDN